MKDITEAATEAASSSAHAAVDATLARLPVVEASKYAIQGELARGGMGRIMAARDRHLERDVAIKQLHDVSGNGGRFVREALLTARLQHPSIVAVHEVGRFRDGAPFLAMKLVRGRSLRDEIQDRTTLESRLELLPNILAVADAMAYSHSQRVIHRDLKPANILIGAFGETVVIDWGIAKELDQSEVALVSRPTVGESPELTEVGTVVGTPMYMPPEQAMGRGVDERADVYAIGALLYHVIAGSPPFEGGDARAVLEQVLTKRPRSFRQRELEVPNDLDAIVRKAMSPRLEDRYRHAGELAVDLRRFQLGQIPVASRTDIDHDPEIERAFLEDVAEATVRPLRITALLALVMVPLFAGVEVKLLGVMQPMSMWARVPALLIAATALTASFTRLRRYAALMAMTMIGVVGLMIVTVNRIQGGVLEAGFVASMMLVMLAAGIMFPIRPRALVITLSLLALAQAAFGPRLAQAVLLNELSFFTAAVLVVGFGSAHRYRVQRAEFYNRYRLKMANERLAVLDRR